MLRENGTNRQYTITNGNIIRKIKTSFKIQTKHWRAN